MSVKLSCIYTRTLFDVLNAKRKEQGITELEFALMGSKIGILFSLASGVYVDFKKDFVTLDSSQLVILQKVLADSFNVDMPGDLLVGLCANATRFEYIKTLFAQQ